jgi:anti-sigma-K factor RskA
MSREGEDSSERAEGDRALVAEFALGLLQAEEHAAAARRIAADPALRRDYRLWRRRLATLDGDFAETPPPPGMLSRIEARLFPPEAARSGFWNSLAFWRAAAAVCLVAAIVGIGFDLAPRPPLSGPELVAALEAAGSNVKFVAFYDQRAGMIRIAALSGSAVPDKDFELWAIEGKNAPVSMGVIPVAGKKDVAMPTTVKASFGAGTVLAVTLEQKGGSPTGAPQGPVVASGTATAI